MAGRYWLVKCEPHECSFDELKARPGGIGNWRGVRNHQARNFIRDGMTKSDLAFFYHSNCAEPGIAGIVEIVEAGYPDPSQFDRQHRYYDEKASPDRPRWYSFDVKWRRPFAHFVPLAQLKAKPALRAMKVVQRGQRLSIQPVTEAEWRVVCRMGGVPASG